jgi:hypothetical protein
MARLRNLKVIYDGNDNRYILAERGGFEPPWELVAPKSISSRSRYDHFGTSPRFYQVAEAGADVTLFP